MSHPVLLLCLAMLLSWGPHDKKICLQILRHLKLFFLIVLEYPDRRKILLENISSFYNSRYISLFFNTDISLKKSRGEGQMPDMPPPSVPVPTATLTISMLSCVIVGLQIINISFHLL
jgi:hypothetical protein